MPSAAALLLLLPLPLPLLLRLLLLCHQAMDIVHPWTLDASGVPLLPITTFSIAMIHRQSGGKLPLFVEVRTLNLVWGFYFTAAYHQLHRRYDP